MTSAAATARPWRLLSIRGLGFIAVAAAIGFGLGWLVDVVWPNPTYGFQLFADAAAFLVVFFAVLFRRVWTLLLPTAIALAVGVIAGVAVGLEVARASSPTYEPGTVKVTLTAPLAETLSGTAECERLPNGAVASVFTAEDGSALRLADGRSLAIAIAPELSDPARSDGLGIEVRIARLTSEGDLLLQTRLVSNTASTLAATGTKAEGSMAFSGLVLHPSSESREPIDVKGSVEWTCPS